MRRVFCYQKKSILSIIFQKKEKYYNTTTKKIFVKLNYYYSCPAYFHELSQFFYVYIQGKKLVKFNFMKCFDNILYNNLTNHTNNAMFFCQKIKKIVDFIFTFFFLDFFLSFPFSGVESNEATDPGCEVEGESSFFGFNKYNMI